MIFVLSFRAFHICVIHFHLLPEQRGQKPYFIIQQIGPIDIGKISGYRIAEQQQKNYRSDLHRDPGIHPIADAVHHKRREDGSRHRDSRSDHCLQHKNEKHPFFKLPCFR